jgi:hypothetical protein
VEEETVAQPVETTPTEEPPPQLSLIGIILTDTTQLALLRDPSTNEVHRLASGEQYGNWEMKIVDARTVQFHQGDRVQDLKMFDVFPVSAAPTEPSGEGIPMPTPQQRGHAREDGQSVDGVPNPDSPQSSDIVQGAGDVQSSDIVQVPNGDQDPNASASPDGAANPGDAANPDAQGPDAANPDAVNPDAAQDQSGDPNAPAPEGEPPADFAPPVGDAPIPDENAPPPDANSN